MNVFEAHHLSPCAKLPIHNVCSAARPWQANESRISSTLKNIQGKSTWLRKWWREHMGNENGMFHIQQTILSLIDHQILSNSTRRFPYLITTPKIHKTRCRRKQKERIDKSSHAFRYQGYEFPRSEGLVMLLKFNSIDIVTYDHRLKWRFICCMKCRYQKTANIPDASKAATF